MDYLNQITSWLQGLIRPGNSSQENNNSTVTVGYVGEGARNVGNEDNDANQRVRSGHATGQSIVQKIENEKYNTANLSKTLKREVTVKRMKARKQDESIEVPRSGQQREETESNEVQSTMEKSIKSRNQHADSKSIEQFEVRVKVASERRSLYQAKWTRLTCYVHTSIGHISLSDMTKSSGNDETFHSSDEWLIYTLEGEYDFQAFLILLIPQSGQQKEFPKLLSFMNEAERQNFVDLFGTKIEEISWNVCTKLFKSEPRDSMEDSSDEELGHGESNYKKDGEENSIANLENRINGNFGMNPEARGVDRPIICTSRTSNENHAKELPKELFISKTVFCGCPSRKYTGTEKLGEGGEGQVFKVRKKFRGLWRPRRQWLAAKVLRISEEEISEKRAKAEIKQMQLQTELIHKNIVRTYQMWIHAPRRDKWLAYYIQEFVDGADLHEVIGCAIDWTVPHIATIAKQIFEGLKYIHEERVVHCDIKPENIILSRKGMVKITDFGLATRLNLKDNTAFCVQGNGTAAYFAPEKRNSEAVTGKVDVWAAGVTLLELLKGKRFGGSHFVGNDERLGNILGKTLESLRWDPVVKELFFSFMKKCLSGSLEDRQSSSEILKDRFVSFASPKKSFKRFTKNLFKKYDDSKEFTNQHAFYKGNTQAPIQSHLHKDL